jgi:CubicO group peptidase (beta-lactamase class C family)
MRADMTPDVQGLCDPRFAPVRLALEENFRDRGEIGAAVALVVDGRPVVDLWAGWMDAARARPWQRDTLVNVFSVGKAMAALALLRLVDRGLVDLEAPVARYWPAFAAAGKGTITVRMLLCHRAGLPAIRPLLPPLAMYDWERMTTALAAEEPWWEPGTCHGYHVNTFGFMVGELVRRVSGETIGAFLRREVTGPLDADFLIGTGPEHDPRIADYLFMPGMTPSEAMGGDPSQPELLQRVYLNPPGVCGDGTVNTRAWRAAEMPSTNAHANARALARIYAPLACDGALHGVRLLGSATLAEAITEAAAGPDAVLFRPSRFGLGFQLTQPERALGPNPRAFGHFGAGGSLGFADPDARLAFGYTMNQAGPRWQNPRVRALITAAYAALAGA